MQHLRALHPADGDGAADLGLVSLVSGFSLILILVAAAQLLDLNLSTTITIAAVRTVLQLLALGCILQPIFDHNEPYVVLPYVLAMACFAARESGARPTFVYPSLGWHVLLALLAGLSASFVAAATLVLRPEPWWDAQLVIPTCGMLLGNAVSALSLGLNQYLKALGENALLRALQAGGATTSECTRPGLQEALRTGLMPTLNSMNVLGLVSIPGMMTGQVLGGSPPLVAAKYQALIMFLICFTSATALYIATRLASHRALFDDAHRLRSHLLVKRAGPKPKDVVLACAAAVGAAAARAWAAVRGVRPTASTAPEADGTRLLALSDSAWWVTGRLAWDDATTGSPAFPICRSPRCATPTARISRDGRATARASPRWATGAMPSASSANTGCWPTIWERTGRGSARPGPNPCPAPR